MKRILVTGGRVVFPESIQETDLLIVRDKIALVGSTQMFDEIVSAENLYILPGLVDIHYHGLFMFPDPKKMAQFLYRAQTMLAQSGVAGFLVAFPATEISRLCDCLSALKEAAQKPVPSGAEFLGVHLEGPFLNKAAKGAQPEDAIVEFDPGSGQMLRIFEAGKDLIKIMTFAPEQKSARELVKLLAEKKIVPSLGHSLAGYEAALEFAGLGAQGVTHLFNGMSGIHHREPGMALAGLDRSFYKEVIVDGFHVHPAMVKLTWGLSPPEKFILVTDMVGDEEPMDSEPPRLSPTVFAGSRLRLLRAVRNLMKFTGAKIPEAVAAASAWPAKIIGRPDLGRIRQGADATLIMVDEGFRLKKIFFKGVLLPQVRDV